MDEMQKRFDNAVRGNGINGRTRAYNRKRREEDKKLAEVHAKTHSEVALNGINGRTRAYNRSRKKNAAGLFTSAGVGKRIK